MSRPAVPLWLAHALRAQRGPVPWGAVIRGALAAGPLLSAGLLAGRTSLGVLAAIAAMLAGINDRPGSRRAAVQRLGVPALAGALGLLVGTYAGQGLAAVPLTLALTGLGLVAGGASAVGPVASAAGTHLLVGAALGAGMPAAESGLLRALAFLTGAGWLLLLRLALPTPGSLAGDFRFDGERAAVAEVYDAVADLVEAVGGPRATARRAALTAALDHAQDALAGPRLRRYAGSAAERRLHAQYAAALPLAEAATALFWAGEPVSARAAEGPRRLAAAVRGNTGTGPLPAPHRSAPALRALDDALLRAAEAFDRADGPRQRPLTRHRGARDALRAAFGTGGREYGLRVALCFGASAAIAQALHHTRWYGPHQHWYWLPATAVFLVKPDLGPLVSRVLCRAAGTVLGALVFAGLAALLPRPAGLIALVAVCGALVPVATRHFAAQTAVVTALVLALVMAGGEPQASVSRIGETLLACALVLIVGHLPMPGRRGGGVRARLAVAGSAAQAYLTHVLGESAALADPDAPGESGDLGTSGGVGRSGALGVSGGLGESGVLGRSGALGESGGFGGLGMSGGPGAPGESGDPGVSGAVGRSGDLGKCGGLGESGVLGRSGVFGESGGFGGLGTSGGPGAPGESGDLGASDVVGRSGDLGECGGLGESGVLGGPGAPGESGGLGVSGALGRSGALGASGVLGRSGDRAERWVLRREAYRTLAEARTAIALAAAELPALARHTAGTDAVADVLERLVDTITACAVHLDDTGRLTPRHLAQLREALWELETQGAEVPLSAAA